MDGPKASTPDKDQPHTFEIGRAEERIALGTYGSSIESGLPIPDEQLEAEPLAERTIEEQRDYETHGSRRF